MKSFPTAFAAEKNKKTGISPVWILKLTVNAIDYYLSDHAFAVATWNGGITTKAWVASWGQIMEQISGSLAEIRIADMQINCLIDPDEATNMETVANHSTLEKSPAILYLWFRGLTASTDPPQEMFRGYVREVDIPDETTVALTIEDATIRLHNLVGTLITTATYANADPDDIGRILPLPYGVVRNVPTRATVAGLLTTLKADITAAATSCTVARPDGIVANTTKFTVGSEIIKVTAVTGDTLTITRAQDSTTAAVHSAGDRLLERVTNPFVFVVSGHALTSIDKVIVRAGEIDVDVTAQCTKYTGQSGSQYSTYGAKGVITITQAQANTIRDLVNKATNTLAIYNPDHAHSGTSTANQTASNIGTHYGGASNTQATVIPAYPYLGEVVQQTTTLRVYFWGGDSGSRLTINGVTVMEGYSSGYYDWEGTTVADVYCTHYRGSGTGAYIELNTTCSRELTYAPDGTAVAQQSTLTGGVNSAADAMLGGPVHADVTAPNTDPDDVFTDLLTTWGGGVSLSLDGSFASSYKFNGVILDQEEILPLLNRLAFQCRSWFRLTAGAARLIVRPDTLTSEKTIAACRIDGGRRVHARRKTAAEDVVNRINLRYDRDWTKPAGEDAYKLVSSTSDATSITDYGERERPEMFLCDFITGATMADSVRDFYLADLKRRKWLHEFEVYLDHAELEFGDIVTLTFAANAVVELMQAGFAAGNTQTMDVIRMVGRG